jgi:hypothetical protein
MAQEAEQILPGHHPEDAHPEAEHVHSDAPEGNETPPWMQPLAPKEPRRDEFSFHLTTAEGDEYSIAAQLEDGETKEVAIHDSRGGTVILPSGVIEQLISAMRMQEQLLRQNSFRLQSLGQFGRGNLAGMSGGQATLPQAQRMY